MTIKHTLATFALATAFISAPILAATNTANGNGSSAGGPLVQCQLDNGKVVNASYITCKHDYKGEIKSIN